MNAEQASDFIANVGRLADLITPAPRKGARRMTKRDRMDQIKFDIVSKRMRKLKKNGRQPK